MLIENLPPLFVGDKFSKRMVSAVFESADWIWYILEGQKDETGYLFFGYVTGIHYEFRYFHEIEILSLGGVRRPVYPSDVDIINNLWQQEQIRKEQSL